MSPSRGGSTNAFGRLRRHRGMKNETNFFRVTFNNQTSKARGIEATNYRALTTYRELGFSLLYSLFELRLHFSGYWGQSQWAYDLSEHLPIDVQLEHVALNVRQISLDHWHITKPENRKSSLLFSSATNHAQGRRVLVYSYLGASQLLLGPKWPTSGFRRSKFK